MCQYPLFETLAVIDGKFRNLAFHQMRVNLAFNTFFKKNCTLDLNKIEIPEIYRTGFYRCRIDYNPQTFKIGFFEHIPRQIRTFHCVQVENFDYCFKYSDRKRLDQLKILQMDEVIIINNGFVSDCTIGNLLFFKNGKWFSPRHYLLKGTQLSYLLAQDQVELTEIRAEDLFHYEKIMVVNALNPFDNARAVPISKATILCDFCDTARKI